MKKSFLQVMILALVAGTVPVSAQYDDIYYSSGATRSRPRPVSNQDNYYGNERYSEQDEYYEEDYDAYDDEAYNYLDEYDYSYTHRIRRFHRPLIGRGFYDPFYWDPWYYDPYYYSRGFGFITPRIGIGFYSFNDFNRWNRWQRYNSFRYWDPWAFSYWSSDPFLFNRYNNFYWANNAWCPTSWYSNNYYINNNFWGNRYNGTYQPRYYTDNNSFFRTQTIRDDDYRRPWTQQVCHESILRTNRKYNRSASEAHYAKGCGNHGGEGKKCTHQPQSAQ